MTPMRRLHALALAFAALALCATPAAHASGGGDEPRDELVSRTAPDFDRDELLHGRVGIVLPSWDAPSQYLAWRAIVTSGKPAFRSAVPAKAASDVPAGWTDAAKAMSAAASAGMSTATSAQNINLPNCNPDAQAFAARTLQAAEARPDATAARVAAWIAAQNQVFALCDRDALEVLKAADPLLAPLPASEPPYWRQLREYQLGAASFYAAHYAQSMAVFTHIANTPGHPMQGWGAYLALRSHLRAMQVKPPKPAQAASATWTPAPPAPEEVADLEMLRQEGALILRDPALAPVHEATAATLRRAAFLLAPRHRFVELTTMLDDLKSDPSRDDTLDDWPYMNYGTGDDAADARTLLALRAAHPWFDWVNAMSRTATNDAAPAPSAAASPASASSAAASCSAECRHAQQAWAHGPSPGKGADDFAAGQHRAWLVALLVTEAPLSAAIEKDALAVPITAPEYATVRYWLANRLAASGRAGEARAMSEALLAHLKAQKPLSTSAINLVTQQRFALATSVADASAYLLMFPVASTNPDTGERADPVAQLLQPSDDGVRWLDRGLSVADLLAVAHALPTPSTWRNRIAVAAWMRADLLGNAPAAEDASKLVEQWVPTLKLAAARYRALPAGAARQHWLIVTALKQGLSPDPVKGYWRDQNAAYPVQKLDEAVADTWCHIGAVDVYDVELKTLETRAVPPEVSADPARRNAERAQLMKMRSATGFVLQHAIAWAEAHPTDRDAPWLLYVAIQSSKGGCIDADNSALSKKAWQVLHKRFPRSPWTEQSPYFY